MTTEEMRKTYYYENGFLYYKDNKNRKNKAIGCINEKGYLATRINGKGYKVHRIIWQLIKGNIPDEIDHINGIRHDNRIENLRDVSHLENMQNRKEHRSGRPVGVRRVGKKWQARIRLHKKYYYLGIYETIEEAINAQKLASIKLTTTSV
jgi:hypothetical protein